MNDYLELPLFTYYQWPPQPTAVFAMCSAHLVTFHPFCHLLGGWPHHARPHAFPQYAGSQPIHNINTYHLVSFRILPASTVPQHAISILYHIVSAVYGCPT